MEFLNNKELYEKPAIAYFEEAKKGNEKAYFALCALESQGFIALTEEEKRACQPNSFDNNNAEQQPAEDNNVIPQNQNGESKAPSVYSFSPFAGDASDYMTTWERALKYMRSSTEIEKQEGVSFLNRAIELAKQTDITDQKVKNDICKMYLDLAHYYESIYADLDVHIPAKHGIILQDAFSNYVLAKEWDENNTIVQDDFLRFVYKYKGKMIGVSSDESKRLVLDDKYILSVEEEYAKSKCSAKIRYTIALHKIKMGLLTMAQDWIKYTLEADDIDENPEIRNNSELLFDAFNNPDMEPFDDALINHLLACKDDTVNNNADKQLATDNNVITLNHNEKSSISSGNFFSPFVEGATDYMATWERALKYMRSSTEIEKQEGVSFLNRAIELAKQTDITDQKVKNDICKMYLDLAHYYESIYADLDVHIPAKHGIILQDAFSNYVLAKEWDENNTIVQDDFLRFVYKYKGKMIGVSSDESKRLVLDDKYILSVEEEYAKSKCSAKIRYTIALHKIKMGLLTMAQDWIKYTLEADDIDENPEIRNNSELLFDAFNNPDMEPFDDALINHLLACKDDTVLCILEEHRPHLLLAALNACSEPDDALQFICFLINVVGSDKDRFANDNYSKMNDVMENLAELYCSKYGSLETAKRMSSLYNESDDAPEPFIAWLIYKYGHDNIEMRDIATKCCFKAADHNIRSARADLWNVCRKSTLFSDLEKMIIERYEEYSKTTDEFRPVLAAYYFKLGDMAKAGEFFDSSNVLDYLPWYIDFLYIIGRYYDAAQICAEIINRRADRVYYDAYSCTSCPYSDFVYRKYAQCLCALDDPRCVDWYTKAAESNDGLACACLAGFYLNGIYVQKSFSTAEVLYQKAISLGFTDAYSYLAAALFEEGNYAEAINLYRKSIELNKKSDDMTKLALILNQENFTNYQAYENEWVSLLIEASRCTPPNVRAEYELGCYYYETDHEKAKYYLSNSFNKDYAKTASAVLLAHLYKSEGNPGKAAELLRSCNNDGSVDYYRAQCFLVILYLNELNMQKEGLAVINNLYKSSITFDISNTIMEVLLQREYYDELKNWLRKSMSLVETDEDFDAFMNLTRQLIDSDNMEDSDEDLLKYCVDHTSQKSVLGDLYVALAQMIRMKKHKSYSDGRKANQYLEKAADYGNAKAMLYLASDYLSAGIPSNENIRKAEEMLDNAMRLGISSDDYLVVTCKKKLEIVKGVWAYVSKAKKAFLKYFE